MYPGVELRLYRYVAVLAEELNFTRAALRLHVAQPSLSKQIRELERYLGDAAFRANQARRAIDRRRKHSQRRLD
jgi:LysR family hca operon transcriptional activator